jgi:EAL domain-containing protein (putative c-di-GMP-specific phosphodiesterase class I)
MFTRSSVSGRPASIDVGALLENPERVRLVAQPLVDLRRGQIVGYETLTRFDLEVPAGPDKVFMQAAQQGLGDKLEALVLGKALRLSESLPPNCFLSINVDPECLISDAVQAVLRDSPLQGRVFELTEHRQVRDMTRVLRAISELRHRGAVVAMDDAGSGYSGLKQLLALRPQLIKLDRELIAGIDTDEVKRALVQMLGEFASRLDAWVLAEGIETEGELRALCQLGVPLGQGYFLARPAVPWAILSEPSQEVLRDAPPSLTQSSLRSLIDVCTVVRGDATWPLAAELCVRLDVEGRPVALRILEAGGVDERSEHELLKVKVRTEPGAVARRATLREGRCRWDPVMCIDDNGRFLGVIRMPRLVTALADASSGGAAAVLMGPP